MRRKQKGAKLGQHLLTNVGIAKIVAYESGAGAGSRVYEIGPGKGILTRELLALGATVHAVEKDPSMVEYLAQEFEKEIREKKLSALEGKIKHEHLSNVKIILSDLEKPNGSTLKDNSIDIVVIPNLLFQAQDKYSIIKEAYRILKTGGQILIIDWQKNSILNLKNEIFNANQAKQMAQEIGFEPKKEFMASDHHYGLLFIKK